MPSAMDEVSLLGDESSLSLVDSKFKDLEYPEAHPIFLHPPALQVPPDGPEDTSALMLTRLFWDIKAAGCSSVSNPLSPHPLDPHPSLFNLISECLSSLVLHLVICARDRMINKTQPCLIGIL